MKNTVKYAIKRLKIFGIAFTISTNSIVLLNGCSNDYYIDKSISYPDYSNDNNGIKNIPDTSNCKDNKKNKMLFNYNVRECLLKQAIFTLKNCFPQGEKEEYTLNDISALGNINMDIAIALLSKEVEKCTEERNLLFIKRKITKDRKWRIKDK